MLFMLVSLFLYIHPYVSTDSEVKARVLYWISFGCFVAAVLSCPIVGMFPVVLVLIDQYVPEVGTGKTGLLRPDRPKWLPQIPFLLVSAFLIAITFLSRYCQSGATWATVFGLDRSGPLERIMQAFYIGAYYIWKVWWPHPLRPLDVTLASFEPTAIPFLASAAAVVAGTYVIFRARKRWPTLWRLWLAYFALLIPVLGLTEHPHFPSDCYGFLVGLLWSWLFAGVLYRLCLKINVRAIACGMSTLVIAILAALSASQIAVWQNTESLFVHMLQTTPIESPYRSKIAFLFGRSLIKDGMYAEAIGVLNAQVAFVPDDAFAHYVLGGWYHDVGDATRAKFHYREAARLSPNEPAYYNDLGVLLVNGGEKVVAQDFFERALKVDPSYAIACHNLGLLFREEGKTEESEAFFAKAQALRLMVSR